jgi:coenzyme F420-reducing hydrogenase delta subunit
MFNLSAAMGPRWAEICRTFTDKIREIGPSPVRMAIRKRKEHTKGADTQ